MKTRDEGLGGILRVYRGGLGTRERRALEEGRWEWTDDPDEADLVPVSRPGSPGPSIPEPGAPTLTPREREILEYLADGWSNEEIADRLGLSVATVKFHASSLYRALGVGRRTEAVREARILGLLDW